MSTRINGASIKHWISFYQAAGINAAFGFGSYFLLVALGMNIFIAQIIAHLAGIVFNYYTYSRHVFKRSDGISARFVVSYVLNYFIGLGFLVMFSHWIASPYLSGACSLVATSIINYFLLKFFVFSRPPAE